MNFDLTAKKFDTEEKIKRSKAVADEIRLNIVSGKSKSAIDFGCGTGLLGFQLIDDFDNVLFVDSSVGMIEQVKQKLADLGKPSSSAVCQDFTIEFPQNITADYIFSSLALHHIKDTERILRCLYSVLNDGGKILVVDLDADDGSFHGNHPEFDGHNGFEQSAISDIATDAGFCNVKIKTFFRGEKLVKGEKIPYSLFILSGEK
jgi:Methylase involved in ubiquinone/menaquinone biosynthesis